MKFGVHAQVSLFWNDSWASSSWDASWKIFIGPFKLTCKQIGQTDWGPCTSITVFERFKQAGRHAGRQAGRQAGKHAPPVSPTTPYEILCFWQTFWQTCQQICKNWLFLADVRLKKQIISFRIFIFSINVCQKYTRFANVLAHLPKSLPKTRDVARQFGTSAAEIAYVFRACATNRTRRCRLST